MKPKYIAEGFHEDAAQLLQEFVEESSVEFRDFVSIWKKHYFSLVFMGRPDQVETCEFTNEIYRISISFMSTPSFYQKVGAVYLLYALYRNQIAVPMIKIRIQLNQWRIVKTLLIEAVTKQYRTLHYVIDYLMINAFTYVAFHTLKGPVTGTMQKVSVSDEIVTTLKSSYKSDIIEYSVSNHLEALRELHVEYLEEKKTFDPEIKVSLRDDSEAYDYFMGDLDKIVKPPISNNKVSENLGSRRAKLKAQSFIGKTKIRYGKYEEDADSEIEAETDFETVVEKKKTTRNKRVPKEKRKVGRPSKKPKPVEPVEEKEQSDDEIDITHLLDQQQDFYLPPEEGECKQRSRPGRLYYKASPKHEEDSSSDPDNPLMITC